VRSMKLLALCALVSSSLLAQVPPLTTTIVGNSATNGIVSPIFVCSPPGDLNRLFVVQKNGLIKVRTPANAAGIWTTVLTITVSGGSEQGLLGMAFHPNFAANGYFYIWYTSSPSPGNNVLRRYTIPAGTDVADPLSGVTLISIPDLETNHNAGGIYFGPDGYLYVPTGDGGGGNDQHGTNGNAQNINTLLGKILRLDVSNPNPPYYFSVPSNPYYGATPGLDEIWAIGLRNPYRSSFDRLTGDFWIGDVGQNAVEEVDLLPAGTPPGANLGWRCMEGLNCTGLSGGTSCVCNSPSLVNPVHTYANSPGYAVIGGYVYRGCAIPQFRGHYIYNRYGNNQIYSFTYYGTVQNLTNRTTELGNLTSVVSFGEDAAGELYICQLSGNLVRKIVPVTPQSVGVVSYGAGTAGCNGATVLSLGCSPTIFNPGETIRSTNGPVGTNGILVVGFTSLPAGSDPFFIGVETLIDVNAPLFTIAEFPVGPGGLTVLPAPIPKDFGLIGVTVYAQEFFVGSSCTPSPLNISSTQGLQITIQP
jgi:glucose/arabinose dehydrogenase